MRQNWRWLWGRHAVEEALRRGGRKVRELWVLHENKAPGVGDLVKLARRGGARVRWVPRGQLDKLAQGAAHQGIALMAEGRSSKNFEEFLVSHPAGPAGGGDQTAILLALDQVQDPHNLGAVARSAACLGARGLLLTERRSSPVTPAAVQSSAGAIESIPVYHVGNLVGALLKLKEKGFWIYGADMSGRPAWETTFNVPMVLVIGSEGYGLRRLTSEHCDELVRIPQSGGGVDSLNASCAASILLYEAVRQSRKGAPSPRPERRGPVP